MRAADNTLVSPGQIAAIEAALAWGEAIEHTAPNGRRYTVRQATPTRAFWRAWEACKVCLQEAGLRVFKIDGQWTVSKLVGASRSTGARPRIIADEPARVGGAPSQPEAWSHHGGRPLPITTGLRIPLPGGKRLLDFQAEDVSRMHAMRSVLLASEMGTGKTVQVIALANAVEAERLLVVCPAKVIGSWQAELDAWRTFPGAPVVLSYEAAVKRADQLDIDWDLVCFDEAHMLASHDSLRAETLIGENGIRAAWRILATGSPIPNKVYGLWPLLNYLQPHAWGSAHDFGMRYGGGRWDHEAQAYTYRGATNLPELNARLRSSVMIRRTKAEVLAHLPPKHHRLVTLQASEEQVRLVAEERRLAGTDPDMIARHLGDVDAIEGSLSTVRRKLAVSKRAATIEYVRKLVDQGEKVVVFGHHAELLNGITNAFGRAAVKIIGGMSGEATQRAVRAFQSDDRVMVCVVSIRAGGAGLTLTAACHAVFAESDWSAAAVDQCCDRIHRIGQTRPCTYHHLAIEGSADVLVYMVSARKRRASREALA